MEVRIESSWKEVLNDEFNSPRFELLAEIVRHEYQTQIVYPPAGRIFAAFDNCPFSTVKVVILGQDPYHEPGQAHGLSFSVPVGVSFPRSLENIFKEMHDDVGKPYPPQNGDLTYLARQGVLLLNTVLTVRKGQANSHKGKGWEEFTENVIKKLSDHKEHIVFILWGRQAQMHKKLIDGKRHLILESAHPSPLSAFQGFFGCKHFSKANEYLAKYGMKPIIW